ncbi:BTB/POZ domain-containing protein 6-like isoform X1 [Aphis craccivora]|uniref:BTB/POZ domain-containing protein 6-like isoform X1 n=1 Tax=Aphis craccivora TaxID=307492 RepID=A0A6G0ZBC0_APHCR|nr:BTB/POZ domain-containing protein 6-like isoform X1 [Aphis craccivora]
MDMQPATRRSSGVLKLGRYIVRCLTAQPDIWLLFLYKCGQLVAVNLHEPVARSVGILDELFQAQQGLSPEPVERGRDRERAGRPIAAIGSPPRSTADGRLSHRTPSSPDSVSSASSSASSPDNDQYRGMDEDDTDDGYTDSDDEPFAYMTGRRFSSTPSCTGGGSRTRRSSSGCGSSYISDTNSRRSSVAAGRRHNSCTDIAEVVDDTSVGDSCRGTSLPSYTVTL